MYHYTNKVAVIATPELIEKFQHPKKFLSYCEACDSFGLRWSCPPIDFNPRIYLSKFKNMVFLGSKITYHDKFLKELTDDDKANYFSNRLLKKLRKVLSQEFLDAELLSDGSRSFGAGSCLWCCKCSRQYPDPAPCKKPNKMRYSLDAFGLDLINLSKDILATPILWQGDPLPEYHQIIFSLALKEDPTPKLLDKIQNIELPIYTMEDLQPAGHSH